jgi:hypothetical protein
VAPSSSSCCSSSSSSSRAASVVLMILERLMITRFLCLAERLLLYPCDYESIYL